ncbi:MAG TPA: hypothetical protein VK489_07220 [Ferruginibacter sp.]|nr:hypothetical protein [Ferruginibacter sp.]
MKQLLILLAAVTLSMSAIAQETKKPNRSTRKEQKRERINALIKQEEEGVVAYKKHFAFGIKLISDGYGVFFEKGYARSIRRASLFQLEISERKHQKEEKQSSTFISTVPFIYGKINFFYPVKLGMQVQYLLGNKNNKNGVSITANAGGGITLGLLRAYELEVDEPLGRKFIRYEGPDSLTFANPFSQHPSGPGLFRGWSQVKLTPGLYLKPSLRFDYGRYNEVLSAIEVGLSGEFYAKKIPQMISNKQKQFFFSAYFSVAFGKRK